MKTVDTLYNEMASKWAAIFGLYSASMASTEKMKAVLLIWRLSLIS